MVSNAIVRYLLMFERETQRCLYEGKVFIELA